MMIPQPAADSGRFLAPQELMELAQWVLWRKEARGVDGKITKVPYNPRRPGHKASSTNPHTWGTYTLARKLALSGGYDGIGFVVTPTDPYVGIDLDHCRDASTGEIDAWALAIVEQMASYTEVSPSGTGLRIFVRGTLPGTKRRRGAIEMYDRARFLTITGDRLPECPISVEARQDALDALCFVAFFDESDDEYTGIDPAVRHRPATLPTMSDAALLETARRAKNGPKFDRLWRGDTSDYAGDTSRADMALCGMLAFYTGPDMQRIDSLFRQSGLVRDKWYEPRGESTYGMRTVAAVLATQRSYYDPQIAKVAHVEAHALPDKVTPIRRTGDVAERPANNAPNIPHAPRGEDDESGESHDTQPGREHLTDMGNARRFVAHCGAYVRYVAVWGTWLIWDGRRWQKDEEGAILELAKATVKAMWHEVAEIDDHEKRVEVIKWIYKSENAARLTAMLDVAKSEPELRRAHTAFDQHDWLLNCQNGTLDLKTGLLREHRQDDLLTKLAPVDYNPAARLPLWEKFIETVTGGDAEMATFLQRAVGYTLTGDTTEEKLFFAHGPTRMGKSTFFEALKAMLGDYAQTADFETFLARPQVGGIRNDIADLVGARMVASIEVDDGKKLAAGLVKTITGGDTIKARHLYKEAFSFLPAFKLWLAANDAPRVDASDGAMWARIVRIPFDKPITNRNPRVKSVLRDAAKAGAAILAWAVRGCLDWQRAGLGIPASIETATEDYRASMDPLKDFLTDCCELEAGAWASTAQLREAYEAWCKANGERYPLTGRKFGDLLAQRGCISSTRRTGQKVLRVWEGIRLVADV